MKLKSKIILSNMFIVMTTLLVIFIIILVIVDRASINSVYQNLLERTDFINTYIGQDLNNAADEVYLNSVDGRTNLEETLQQFVGCQVIVTGKNPKNPDELQKLALTGQKSYLIFENNHHRVFNISFPIYLKDKIAGSVTIKYPLTAVDDVRNQLRMTLLILGLSGFIFSLLLSFLFSSKLVYPIIKLGNRTKEIADGNFEGSVEIKTRDELGTLAELINDMAKKIHSMIKQLRDEHKKQKTFVDNVTHELRTPLTNIIGFADIVENTEELEARTGYLKKVKGEGQRLLSMVNQLLDLSKLGQYEETFQFTYHELDSLIRDVQSTMEPRLLTFGFQLDLSLQKVSAFIDSNKIKQVMINLVDNAIKYSEGDQIEITLYKEEQNIYITVSDNGRGISKNDLEKITEPFFRVDKSRSRSEGGTGLGLSICNEILKKHDGSLSIYSEENMGTVVSVLIKDMNDKESKMN